MCCTVYRRRKSHGWIKKWSNRACQGCASIGGLDALHVAQRVTCCQGQERWTVWCHGLSHESCEYSQEECCANSSLISMLLKEKADSLRRDKTWTQFPFRDNAADGACLTVSVENQLIELSTDGTFRNMYETKPFTQFWISCQKEFPQLAAKAMMSPLPFATTCHCESGFSSLTYLKNKYTSRLQPEANMTLCLTTSIHPRLGKLCATHQGQTSH